MSTDFWWLWIVIIFVLFALLIWFFGKRKEPAPPNMAHPSAHEVNRTKESPQETETGQSISSQLQNPLSVEPDNLEIIEGIDLEVAALLREAGITTFAALAAAEMSRLDSIINAANLQDSANPYSWQQQAALAAEDRWGELNEYQTALKGSD